MPDQILQKLKNSHLAWKCHCKDLSQSLIFEATGAKLAGHCIFSWHQVPVNGNTVLACTTGFGMILGHCFGEIIKNGCFWGTPGALEIVGINVQKWGKNRTLLRGSESDCTLLFLVLIKKQMNTLPPPLSHISGFYSQPFLPSFLTLHFSLEYKMSFHDDNYHLKSIPSVHVLVLNFRPVYPNTNQSSSEVWMFSNQNSSFDNSWPLLLTPPPTSLPTNQFSPCTSSLSWWHHHWPIRNIPVPLDSPLSSQQPSPTLFLWLESWPLVKKTFVWPFWNTNLITSASTHPHPHLPPSPPPPQNASSFPHPLWSNIQGGSNPCIFSHSPCI